MGPQQAGDVVAHVAVVVSDEDAATRGERKRPVDPGDSRRVRPGRIVRRRHPAQRLLDEGVDAGRRRGQGSLALQSRLRQMMRPCRQHHAKGGADIHGALDRDLPPVQPHQLVDERQADPGALVGPRPRPGHAVEALEDVRQMFRWDADSGILNRERHAAGKAVDANGDASVERVLQRIRNQVQDHLLPHVAVHPHIGGHVVDVDRQLQAGAFGRGAKCAGDVGGQRAQVGAFEACVGAAGLEPGKIQQRIHQLQQAHLVAVDDLQVVAAERPVGGLEGILRRPQHQRQGCAEFVADVAEKDRLRAIELGERFGAAPLFLVGGCGGDGRGHVPRHQIEKSPVRIVELQTGAQPHDHRADGPFLNAPGQGQQTSAADRFRPAAAAQLAELFGYLDRDRRGRAHHRRQRPRRLVVGESDHVRTRGGEVDGHAADQARAVAVVVDQVQQREREVGLVASEGRHRAAARLVLGHRLEGVLAEFPERQQAARAEDPLGGLHHRRKDAADAAALVTNRAVRPGEVCLFAESAPPKLEHLILGPRGVAVGHDALEHRPDHIPDLAPRLHARAAQDRRMFLLKDGHVGVVVENAQGRSPPQDHRKPRGETDADGRAEALRPFRQRAEGGRAPVEGPHAMGHLAVADKDLVCERGV